MAFGSSDFEAFLVLLVVCKLVVVEQVYPLGVTSRVSSRHVNEIFDRVSQILWW